MGKGFEIQLCIPRTATTEEVDYAVLKHLDGLSGLLPEGCKIKEVLSDAVNIGSRRLLLGTSPDNQDPFWREDKRNPAAPSCDLETALDRWRKVSERLSEVKAERDGYKAARDFLVEENKGLNKKLSAIKKLLSEEAKT